MLSGLRQILPKSESAAIERWVGSFLPFQRTWLLDWHRFALALKARQLGASHSYAGTAAIWALLGESTMVVSVGEREAAEVLEKAYKHATALHELGSERAKVVRRNAKEMVLASGGRVLALPATSGGRGYSGNVILDEFAYHADPERVWDGAGAAALHNGRIRVISTPNGAGNLFHKMWSEPAAHEGYALHKVTIEQAIDEGFPVDMEACWRMARGDSRVFAQMFQCEFLTRGGAIFSGVTYSDSLPTRYRVAIGVDFAYSTKTSADYSVAVVLATDGTKMYVLDVRRAQVAAPVFGATLADLAREYPGAPMFSYIGGTEIGIVDFMRSKGIPITSEHARQDKYTRAQAVASHWNAGRVLVPRKATWLTPFVNEVLSFNGVDDPHDDQIDSLVSAYSALSRSVAPQRDLSNLPSR